MLSIVLILDKWMSSTTKLPVPMLLSNDSQNVQNTNRRVGLLGAVPAILPLLYILVSLTAFGHSWTADILLRGFRGWNTRRAVAVLEKFFPKDHPSQPALVIVFFGSNDAAFPVPSGKGQHVPLPEFKANLRQICTHIKGLSDTSRVVLITAPPVYEEARRAHARCRWGSHAGNYPDRTNERAQEYAEACLEVAKEMDVGAVDLWNAIQRTKDWETECLSDGLHLSPVGNQILLEELLKVLKSANWVPNLHWESLPNDFDETSIYDYVHPSEELPLNDHKQPTIQ